MGASPEYIAALRAATEGSALEDKFAASGLAIPGMSPPSPAFDPAFDMRAMPKPLPDEPAMSTGEPMVSQEVQASPPAGAPKYADKLSPMQVAGLGLKLPAGIAQPLPPEPVHTSSNPSPTIGGGEVGYQPRRTTTPVNGAAEPSIRIPRAGTSAAGASVAFKAPVGVTNALNEQEGALKDITRAQQHANDVETVGNAQTRQLLEDQEKEVRERARNFESEAKSREEAIEQESKRLSSVKIDPDRIWHNDNGSRFAAFLVASALGGWVQGRWGGPNQGLEAAQRMIDRDVAAQREDIETGRQRVQDMKGSLAEFYKRTGNMDQAVALAQAKAYDHLIAQTKEQMSGVNSELIEANGNKSIADFHLQREQWLAQAADARAKAMAAAANASNANVKKFQELTDKYVSDGKSLYEAQKLAAGVLGVGADFGDQPGIHKGQSADESAKAKTERDAITGAIDRASNNLSALTKGGQAGALAAEYLPTWIPGVEEAVNNAGRREDYNVKAMMAVGAAYKLDTNANEPKNRAILEHYAAPYVITPKDTPETAAPKIERLKQLMNDTAAARGVPASELGSSGSSTPPKNFKPAE